MENQFQFHEELKRHELVSSGHKRMLFPDKSLAMAMVDLFENE